MVFKPTKLSIFYPKMELVFGHAWALFNHGSKPMKVLVPSKAYKCLFIPGEGLSLIPLPSLVVTMVPLCFPASFIISDRLVSFFHLGGPLSAGLWSVF